MVVAHPLMVQGCQSGCVDALRSKDSLSSPGNDHFPVISFSLMQSLKEKVERN